LLALSGHCLPSQNSSPAVLANKKVLLLDRVNRPRVSRGSRGVGDMQSRNWVPLASLFVLQATASYGQEAIGKATSVRPQEPTTIGQKMEGLASDQFSETSDAVLKKAKVTVAAKMQDPASVEFVDVRRAVNKIGQSFETICGHVKGKKKSGEAIGE